MDLAKDMNKSVPSGPEPLDTEWSLNVTVELRSISTDIHSCPAMRCPRSVP